MKEEYRKGYCRDCEKNTEFEYIDEFQGLEKWKCKECGSIRIK